VISLGVVSDTHIPDRVPGLNPRVTAIFRETGVSAILHAGDILTPAVLEELGEIAPVHAVRGNRDWVYLRHLPFSRTLDFGGVAVGLIHGHGRWWNYLADRTRYILEGYRLERFKPRLLAAFPHARVIVFGHTHRPLNCWLEDRLLFNPGSACCPDFNNHAPSVGLLHIRAGGEVEGEILSLE